MNLQQNLDAQARLIAISVIKRQWLYQLPGAGDRPPVSSLGFADCCWPGVHFPGQADARTHPAIRQNVQVSTSPRRSHQRGNGYHVCNICLTYLNPRPNAASGLTAFLPADPSLAFFPTVRRVGGGQCPDRKVFRAARHRVYNCEPR